MVEEFPSGNKLFGFYRGQVVKHCKHGKCKIWIPSVYPLEYKSKVDLIPDAEQATPLFGGSFAGNGVFSWPNIGSIVWCFFQNGDQNLPVYFAATLGGIDAYDQYIECANLDNDVLNDEVELARAHSINIGKTALSLCENGKFHAKTMFPLQSATGTIGANCSYAEYLTKVYADKGLWESSDVFQIEENGLRVALGIKKKGLATVFKSAVKSDIDSKPPQLDAFFSCSTDVPTQNAPMDMSVLNDILAVLMQGTDGEENETTSTNVKNADKLSLIQALITILTIIVEMWGQSIYDIVNAILEALSRKKAIEILQMLSSVSGTDGSNMLIPAELMPSCPKSGIYFCTIGTLYDDINGKYDMHQHMKSVEQQLEIAKKGNYALFVCQADFFEDKPIVENFDMANKRQIQERKDKIKPIIDQLASKYETNILAICPKHTWSDFSFTADGEMSASTVNDFTQISSTLNIDTSGLISAYTSHIMSADMMSSDNWNDLGYSFSRASIDSSGNTFLDGVYTTATTEVSCIFDMTTKEHIRAELNSLEVDKDDKHKKKAVVCSYECDTLSGIADLSVVFYDFENDDKTYSRIRLTKDGEISVNCTEKLDVLVKQDDGHSKSHMSMHQNGTIGIDSTDSISVKAPSITIEGDNVTMTGNSSTNITGKTGDCKIDKVSLVKHIHACCDHNTQAPIKQ